MALLSKQPAITPETPTKPQENYQKEREIIKALPRKIRFRIALTGFWTAIIVAFVIFMLSFFTDFFSDQIIIPQKYVSQPISIVPSLGEQTLPSQYLYDGKKYPNIPEKMPVYQLIGTLANTSSLIDRITTIKLGNINLKSFPERKLANIELSNPQNPAENISLNFTYGNISLHALQLAGEKWNPDDQKSFLKNSEKKLKERGIHLNSYAKAQVKTGGIIFYPFLLNNTYPIRDAQTNSPRGMRVRYDQKNHTLSLINIDMGQYAYMDTSLLTKTQILKNFKL